MNSTLGRFWHAFANALANFFDEAAFRAGLGFDVILGRLPLEVEKRYWNRSLERPVLIDVFDWTDDRRIFSVLVWPSLESSVESATYDHRERISTVMGAISKGAAEMSWSTRYETDYCLRWDHERRVWTARDGFAYDGQRTHDAA